MLHFLEWKGTENPLVAFKTKQARIFTWCSLFTFFLFFFLSATTSECQDVLYHFQTSMEHVTGWRVRIFMVSDKSVITVRLYFWFFSNHLKLKPTSTVWLVLTNSLLLTCFDDSGWLWFFKECWHQYGYLSTLFLLPFPGLIITSH